MIFNVVGGGGPMAGFKESAEHPGCLYRVIDGVTEWLNPPMVTGVEYRTTERHNGKPVYAKDLNIGSVSADTNIEHNTNIEQPVSCDVHNNNREMLTSYRDFQFHVDRTKVAIKTASTFGNISLLLKYTKI